jgi:hypothetical protein
MKDLRIRWKAVIPAVGIVIGVLSDPSVLALLPQNWAHVIVAISAIAAIFTPAVATNRPSSSPAAVSPAEKAQEKFGLNDEGQELNYPYGDQ